MIGPVSKKLNNLSAFSPFRELEYWILVYMAMTACAVYSVYSVPVSIFRHYPNFGGMGRTAFILILPEALAFAIMLFCMATNAPYGEKDHLVLPLIFSLALTAPVFFADGYIIYLLLQIH